MSNPLHMKLFLAILRCGTDGEILRKMMLKTKSSTKGMRPICEKITAPPSMLSLGTLSRESTILPTMNPSGPPSSPSDLPLTKTLSQISDKSSSGQDLKAPSLLSSTSSDVPLAQTLSSSSSVDKKDPPIDDQKLFSSEEKNENSKNPSSEKGVPSSNGEQEKEKEHSKDQTDGEIIQSSTTKEKADFESSTPIEVSTFSGEFRPKFEIKFPSKLIEWNICKLIHYKKGSREGREMTNLNLRVTNSQIEFDMHLKGRRNTVQKTTEGDDMKCEDEGQQSTLSDEVKSVEDCALDFGDQVLVMFYEPVYRWYSAYSFTFDEVEDNLVYNASPVSLPGDSEIRLEAEENYLASEKYITVTNEYGKEIKLPHNEFVRIDSLTDMLIARASMWKSKEKKDFPDGDSNMDIETVLGEEKPPKKGEGVSSVINDEKRPSSEKEEGKRETSSMDIIPPTKVEENISNVDNNKNECSEGRSISSAPVEVDVHYLRYSSLQIIYELAKQDVNYVISNVAVENSTGVSGVMEEKEETTSSEIKIVERNSSDIIGNSSVMNIVIMAWYRMMSIIAPPSEYLLKSEEAIDQSEQLVLVNILILYLRVNENDVKTLFEVIKIYQKSISIDLRNLTNFLGEELAFSFGKRAKLKILESFFKHLPLCLRKDRPSSFPASKEASICDHEVLILQRVILPLLKILLEAHRDNETPLLSNPHTKEKDNEVAPSDGKDKEKEKPKPIKSKSKLGMLSAALAGGAKKSTTKQDKKEKEKEKENKSN